MHFILQSCLAFLSKLGGLNVRETIKEGPVRMVGHRLGAVVLVEGRVDKNFAVCAFMVMTAFLEKSMQELSTVNV